MKISWGIKIAVLYIGFVALILSMVSMAMRQKVDLVSKDYYEQEIKFQDNIDKSNRALALEEPLTWELSQGMLQLKFPAEFQGKKISGSVYFFRPSDAELDKTIPLATDLLQVNIPTDQLKPGAYKMQINWKVNEIEYYNEGVIRIK